MVAKISHRKSKIFFFILKSFESIDLSYSDEKDQKFSESKEIDQNVFI